MAYKRLLFYFIIAYTKRLSSLTSSLKLFTRVLLDRISVSAILVIHHRVVTVKVAMKTDYTLLVGVNASTTWLYLDTAIRV
jgi:hypothetical protein